MVVRLSLWWNEDGKHYRRKDSSITISDFTPDGKALYVLLATDTGILIENGMKR